MRQKVATRPTVLCKHWKGLDHRDVNYVYTKRVVLIMFIKRVERLADGQQCSVCRSPEARSPAGPRPRCRRPSCCRTCRSTAVEGYTGARHCSIPAASSGRTAARPAAAPSCCRNPPACSRSQTSCCSATTFILLTTLSSLTTH